MITCWVVLYYEISHSWFLSEKFAVVGELRIHEDLGGSTISRFGDDVPVSQLLRSRAVSSLILVIVDIPVVPGDVVVDVGRKIVCLSALSEIHRRE